MKETKYTETRTIKCGHLVRAVRFNVDGDYIITTGSDRTLKLWAAETGALLLTYSGHSGEVLDARGSCDNGQILSGSTDKTAIVWDVSTGRPLRRLRGHTSTVTTAIFNEESTLAMTGSQDNSVKIWDLRSKSNNTPIQVLAEPKDCITSLSVNNNGILVGSTDCYIRFYDIRNGKLSTDCLGEAVTCACVSRDGASNLASVANGTCKLLDKDTGQLLANYTGFSTSNYFDYKVECSFDYSDSYVIVGSPLGKAVIFDLIEEKIVQEIPHESAVVSLSSHSNRDRFVSASHNSITIFDNKA